jgi:16S rRNA (cytosine967-C5)-methyltransferase
VAPLVASAVGWSAEALVRALETPAVWSLVVGLYAEARSAGAGAGPVLRTGARAARSLRSADRRLALDLVFGLIRHGGALARHLHSEAPDVLLAGLLAREGLEVGAVARGTGVAEDALRRAAQLEGDDGLPMAAVAGVSAWGATALERSLGVETRAFVAASNARAPVVIRVNLRKTGREALARRLRATGVETCPTQLAPLGLVVQGRHNLAELDAFRDGSFEVQDEGSQLLAALVPSQGEVLDLCAGAGGKSLALAAAGASVVATDVRKRALSKLSTRARRAGARIQTLALGEGGMLPRALRKRRFNAILVDAPCSGSGTWRRHPELRWQLEQDAMAQRQGIQRSVLATGARLVKPGGTLVYGTCSVLREENEDVVAAFLAAHPDFVLREPILRLRPDTHGCDGFFGARLRKGR